MVDPREYVNLARESGAFKDIELDILQETISAWVERPGDPTVVVEIRDGKVLAGFAIMCKEASSEFTFDIRAICIDPHYIGKGVADSIIEALEDQALLRESSTILRAETSSKKEMAVDAGVFPQNGFALIGHIPDFYESGDDYFMFAKHIHRAVASAAKGAD
jgi:GNAT superfamily N-acetyltransferase